MERRKFVKMGAVAGAAAMMPKFSFAQVKGNDRIKVGLVGCGGRGTGATRNMIDADRNIKIVGFADLFEDKLPLAVKNIKEHLDKKYPKESNDVLDVNTVKKFAGWDAIDALLKEDVDLIIDAAPPCFRTPHYAKIVEAGKHAFLEKPACIDITQAREMMELSKKATEKGLSVVCGNQRRYYQGYQEAIKRVQDGGIGEMLSAQVYWNSGAYVGEWQTNNLIKQGKLNYAQDSIEYQVRNWFSFIWTSGDHLVEQHVHNIDVVMWALGDNRLPIDVRGFGGRSTDLPVHKYGDRYSHFAVDFDMGDGFRLSSYCHQDPKTAVEVGERIVGTNGIMYTNLYGNMTITDRKGKVLWQFDKSQGTEALVNEHAYLLNSVRNGLRVNKIDPLLNSNLLAIAGRMSAFSGKKFKYDWMLNRSKENLMPEKLDWGVIVPLKPVPVPGAYPLV